MCLAGNVEASYPLRIVLEVSQKAGVYCSHPALPCLKISLRIRREKALLHLPACGSGLQPSLGMRTLFMSLRSEEVDIKIGKHEAQWSLPDRMPVSLSNTGSSCSLFLEEETASQPERQSVESGPSAVLEAWG